MTGDESRFPPVPKPEPDNAVPPVALSNGIRVPGIGFGTFPQKEELLQSLPAAVRTGFRLVDASDNYSNEQFVGDALATCGTKDVVVATKFSQPLRTFDLARCFEESRRRIGGRIDIYLLHWPYPHLWECQWRRMEELYLSGRCRAIGVCNFERDRLRRLLRFCRVRPMVDQFERHPLFQQAETARFCRENGIRVMCYSPLARMDVALMENQVLREIAAKHGKSVPQTILRWSVEHGDIPIPASRKAAHIEANFDIGGFSLTPEEISRIDGLDAGHRIRFDPRTRFDRKAQKQFLRCRLEGILHSFANRLPRCFSHAAGRKEA